MKKCKVRLRQQCSSCSSETVQAKSSRVNLERQSPCLPVATRLGSRAIVRFFLLENQGVPLEDGVLLWMEASLMFSVPMEGDKASYPR